MPVSTAKAVASTSLVGGGGIIGTTIPSVNLSSAKAENEKLTEAKEQLEQAKEDIEKSQNKESVCYWIVSKRLMQYQWKYNYSVTNNGGDGVQPFGTELTSAFYVAQNKFKNIENIPKDCDPNLSAFVKALPEDIKNVEIG